MPQEHGSRQDNRRQQQERGGPVALTALALRGMGQAYDMNLSIARRWVQAQARAASALGWPDWSGLLGDANGGVSRLFTDGAERFVNTAQRANEAAAELQREVGRVVETQASTAAETLQQGLEEISAEADEGLNQLVETMRQQADEAQRVASLYGSEMRAALQQSGEQLRDSLQRGGELTRDASQQVDEQEPQTPARKGRGARKSKTRRRAT